MLDIKSKENGEIHLTKINLHTCLCFCSDLCYVYKSSDSRRQNVN